MAGSKLIAKEFERLGMSVHLGIRGTDGKKDVKSKTEAVFFPSQPKQKPDPLATSDLNLGNGYFISFCDNFPYLGTIISSDLKDDTDIKTRIRKARTGFAMMRSVLTDHRLRQSLRIQLYKQIPLNIALWGCDSWALKDDHIRQLAQFHHDSIRSILGFRKCWHKELHYTMKQVLIDANIESMEQLVTTRTLRFLGKVARMPEDRLTRRMIHTQAKANGPLARGRKPTTTKDWYVKCLKEAELVDSDIISMANWGHHFYDPEIDENIRTNLDITVSS